MADVLTDDELMRYSRQILLDGWDIDAQIRLKNAKILIVGMGGLGCPVSQILARAGVGHMCLIDHDVIDDSNLQRQTLFTKDDIGKPKSEVAKIALQQQNHLINITNKVIKITDENIDEIFNERFDLVIDCTDNFAIRDLLNKTCIRHDIPLLSNSAIAEMGQIAIFEKHAGCYQCVFGSDKGDDRTCANSGVLASTVSVIGSMTAQIALDFLGRGQNPIKSQLLLWQGRTMSLRKLNFHKNPQCPICSETS